MIIAKLRILIIANLRGVDWITPGSFIIPSLKGSVIIGNLKGSISIGSLRTINY